MATPISKNKITIIYLKRTNFVELDDHELESAVKDGRCIPDERLIKRPIRLKV